MPKTFISLQNQLTYSYEIEEGMTSSFTVRDSLSPSCGLLRMTVMLSREELSSRIVAPTERAISGSPSTISRV